MPMGIKAGALVGDGRFESQFMYFRQCVFSVFPVPFNKVLREKNRKYKATHSVSCCGVVLKSTWHTLKATFGLSGGKFKS